MSERWLEDDIPPTAEELEAARRLAESMGKGASDGIGGDVLSASRMLASLAPAPPMDEVSSLRLRRDLMAQTVRARQLRVAWRWGAAAGLAASIVLAAALWTALRPPSARSLEEHERAARAAVGAISKSAMAETSDSDRTEKIFEEQWSTRLDSALEQRRFVSLSEPSGAGGSSRTATDAPQSAIPLPIPGGLS